ncbi:MAG: CPBP family intramembrane metalloprotease, partial [Proteobacteria bacterium]|nr:CPBP family intramembrane metalloprotease [Pseudomonadota bacterium]
LLFRGWLTSIGFRLQKSRLAGMGPFFPIWLWGTSLAFSVWHLQNVGSSSPGQLVLQLVFTFFAGIWLGVIRWNTGRIWPCIIAHFFINFAADWKLWFVI